MKLKILFIFFSFFCINNPLQAGWWEDITSYFNSNQRAEPPSIRVLILHDAENANLEVQGKYNLYDPYTNSHISSRFAGKSRMIQASSDGLRWGEAFPGLYQLKIKTRDLGSKIILNDHQYESPVYIYDIGGTLSAVTEISVEDYVKSILASHQSQHLEPEALAALAIVVRTNAYFQALNPKNTYWAVDAQKVGYPGSVSLYPNEEEAVRLTRYMILSRTGVYEGIATPFAVQFGDLTKDQSSKDVEVSKISLEEANEMARSGDHAAQILAKAFPRSTMMIMQYSKN